MEKCVLCGSDASCVCKQCKQHFYCGVKCQQEMWLLSHHIGCFVQLIGGKKRDAAEIEQDDRALSARYEQLFSEYKQAGKDRKFVVGLEELFGKMSPDLRAKYVEGLPFHQENDVISHEPLSSLQPDNVASIMVGAIKYGFSTDMLAGWLQSLEQGERKVMIHPLTGGPLSDEDLGLMQEAISSRREAELRRVYETGDLESLHNLLSVYQVQSSDFDWTRLPFRDMSEQYVARIFSRYADIRNTANLYDAFKAYVKTNSRFWYWAMRLLSPEERHEESDEQTLLKAGIKKMKSVPATRFFVVYQDEDDGGDGDFQSVTKEVFPASSRASDIRKAYEQIDLPNYTDGPYELGHAWVMYNTSWVIDEDRVGETSDPDGYDFVPPVRSIGRHTRKVVASLALVYDQPIVELEKIVSPFDQAITLVPEMGPIDGQFFIFYPDGRVPEDERAQFEGFYDKLKDYAEQWNLVVTLEGGAQEVQRKISIVPAMHMELIDFIHEYVTVTDNFGPWIGSNLVCTVILGLLQRKRR